MVGYSEHEIFRILEIRVLRYDVKLEPCPYNREYVRNRVSFGGSDGCGCFWGFKVVLQSVSCSHHSADPIVSGTSIT